MSRKEEEGVRGQRLRTYNKFSRHDKNGKEEEKKEMEGTLTEKEKTLISYDDKVAALFMSDVWRLTVTVLENDLER